MRASVGRIPAWHGQLPLDRRTGAGFVPQAVRPRPRGRARVVLMPALTPAIIDLARRHAPASVEVVVADARQDAAGALAAVASADFVMALARAVTPEVLRAARGRVRLVQLLSAGYDEMDVGLAAKYGLPVALNGGANAASVGEHIVLLILASYRHLVDLANQVRRGNWGSSFTASRLAYEIEGKTIGLVGMGNIGRAAAVRLRGFGASLLYFDVARLPRPTERELDVTYRPMVDLLREADVISLQLPLLPGTTHLIGEAELSLMKPSALLVNTARGALVDETALARALAERRILGAALDVLSEEPPPPGHPLLGLDNCLVTPHCAGPTWDSWPKRFRNGFGNIERVLRGEAPWWVVL